MLQETMDLLNSDTFIVFLMTIFDVVDFAFTSNMPPEQSPNGMFFFTPGNSTITIDREARGDNVLGS